MEVKLYTEVEREAAEKAFSRYVRNEDYRLVQAAARSLPKRKAALAAFQRTGKLPPTKLSPTITFKGHKMTDAEASRVVLPRFPSGLWNALTDPLPEECKELRNPVLRYLKAMQVKVLSETVSEAGGWAGGWPNYSRSAVTTFKCGCVVTSYGVSDSVEVCKRHKRALKGREEEEEST